MIEQYTDGVARGILPRNEALRLRPEYLKADYGSAILFENKGGLARAEDRCKEALWISLPRPYG